VPRQLAETERGLLESLADEVMALLERADGKRRGTEPAGTADPGDATEIHTAAAPDTVTASAAPA
jgi:hypothetical protein